MSLKLGMVPIISTFTINCGTTSRRFWNMTFSWLDINKIVGSYRITRYAIRAYHPCPPKGPVGLLQVRIL